MEKSPLSFQLTLQVLDSSRSSWRLDRSITRWLIEHNWVCSLDSNIGLPHQTKSQEYQSKVGNKSIKRISTKQVKSLIETCGVWINQTQTYRSSLRVHDGDWIDLVPPSSWMHNKAVYPSQPDIKHPLTPVEKATQSLKDQSLDIRYQDQWHLVVNKPSGLPTTPTRDPRRPSLFHYVLKSQWMTLSDPPPYLRALHRLDLPTSGLVVMSKDPQVNSFFDQAFKEHKIQKRYLALTSSKPSLFPHQHKARWIFKKKEEWVSFIHKHVHSDRFEVSPPMNTSQSTSSGEPQHSQVWFDLKTTLHIDSKSSKKQTRWQVGQRVESPEVKNYAHSSFSLLALYHPSHSPPLWLIEVRLHTGRTHQIRAHLSYLKAPLVGDSLYGGQSPWPFFGLHARTMMYPHPHSFSPLLHLAPLPNSWLVI